MAGSEKEKGSWPSDTLPSSWEWIPFKQAYDNVTSSSRKLKQKQYLQEGSIPVVDQGKELIGGYTENKNILHESELPCIVFGDHTRCVKYVDFNFVQGADGVKVLKPTELYSPEFSYRALQAVRLPDKGYSRHFKFLKETSFPLPPSNEQKRIAEKITTLEAKSKKAKQALEEAKPLLDKLRQSILASAFRGDLTAEWRKKNPDVESASVMLERIRAERRKKWEQTELAKMRAKGKEPINDKWKSKYKEPEPFDTEDLPELPEGWCWIKLPECGEMARGKSKHRPRNDPKLFGNKYPFIQTGEVAQSNGCIKTAKKFYSDFGLSQSRLFPIDTVCITIAANIADTSILGIEACFPDSVVGIIVNPKITKPSLLETYIRTIKNDLSAFAPATAQKNINLSILKEVVIPIPPLQEQNVLALKIEKSLLAVDKMEERLKSSSDSLNFLNQSILSKAFRGELVDQNPSDEPAKDKRGIE